MNLAWWLERAAWEWPEKTAIVSADGSRCTYQELHRTTDRLAAFFRDRCDVSTDEVVVALLPDDHVHVAAFYATMKIGGVFTSLSRIQEIERLIQTVRTCRSRTLVTVREHLETAENIFAQTSLERLVVLDETVVQDGHRLGAYDVLTSEDPVDVRIVPRSNDDLAAVNFTSGTTGPGKGVKFTHGSLGASALATVFWHGIKSSDVNLACISMFHSGGIHDAVKWVLAGATQIWMGGWDRDRMADLIEQERPTWIYFLVPTMVRDLMSSPRWETLPVGGVKTNLSGEAVPAALQQELLDRGMRPVNAFGMTETMPVGVLVPPLYYDADREAPAGSSGRPNREFCEVRLVDPHSGNLVTDPGHEGEIQIRGDVVTPGYLDPDDDARSFTADGWLCTKDLAHFDEDGFYWVGGRTDEVINSGAEKLSLVEVEETLRSSPIVADVACIGADHERFGQCAAAFVATTEPMTSAEVRDALNTHCLATMERWKRPRLYVVVDEVPRTYPKRNKNIGALRNAVAGIKVPNTPNPVTMEEIEVTNA